MTKIDQTIWTPIPTWEKNYLVSNTGLIKSLFREVFKDGDITAFSGNLMRPSFDRDCYLRLTLKSRDRVEHWRIHQLVALVFVPNPNNLPIPHHKNTVRWDNRAENLEWVTQSENIQHAYDGGTKTKKGTSVNQLDFNGNLIKKYAACRHVEADGFSSRTVNKVILGQRSSYKGFLWEATE